MPSAVNPYLCFGPKPRGAKALGALVLEEFTAHQRVSECELGEAIGLRVDNRARVYAKVFPQSSTASRQLGHHGGFRLRVFGLPSFDGGTSAATCQVLA